MKRVAESGTAISGINVVPIIDITLVLLVILLVMSPLVNIPNLSVNLPQAVTKETKDQNVTVSLAKDGSLSVDSDMVTIDKLPSRLRLALRDRKDIVVIIRADKDLPYGRVENLIRLVNLNAGRWPVAIATQQRTDRLEPEQQ